jgi:hypothetical protein
MVLVFLKRGMRFQWFQMEASFAISAYSNLGTMPPVVLVRTGLLA